MDIPAQTKQGRTMAEMDPALWHNFRVICVARGVKYKYLLSQIVGAYVDKHLNKALRSIKATKQKKVASE